MCLDFLSVPASCKNWLGLFLTRLFKILAIKAIVKVVIESRNECGSCQKSSPILVEVSRYESLKHSARSTIEPITAHAIHSN